MSRGYYLQPTIDALAEHLDADGTGPELMRLYALLVHAKGPATTCADVHNAWSLARSATRPDHVDHKWFGELTDEVQSYDEAPRDAIAAVARELAS